SATSAEAGLPGAPRQAVRADSPVKSRPPSACLRPSHSAALGHDDPPGRTRRFDVAVGPFAAVAGNSEKHRPLPSTGIVAACLSRVLLFITTPHRPELFAS